MNYNAFKNWCQNTQYHTITAGVDDIKIMVPINLYRIQNE